MKYGHRSLSINTVFSSDRFDIFHSGVLSNIQEVWNQLIEIHLIHVTCAVPVSSELFTAEHAETTEAAVVSLLLLLLQHLLLWKTNTVSETPQKKNNTSSWDIVYGKQEKKQTVSALILLDGES